MRSKVIDTFIKAFTIYGNNEAESKGLIRSLVERK